MGRLATGRKSFQKSVSFPVDWSIAPEQGKESKLDKIENQASVDGYGNLSGLVSHLLEKWWKEFGAGNPGFKLDNFFDPGFSAMPAFARSSQDWEKWLAKQNANDFKEWDLKLNDLCRLSSKYNTRGHYDQGKNPNDTKIF